MKLEKIVWFLGGLLSGLTALTFTRASVPNQGVDDTALYQELSEIRVKKEAKIDFDSDIQHLAQMENQYREKLPSIHKRRELRKVHKPIAVTGKKIR